MTTAPSDDVVRTPDARFVGLPDWPFAPRRIDTLRGFEGLRLACVDSGGRGPDGTSAPGQRIFLCLHGQPTWGYLYRRFIPRLVAAGHRVVVPDLFGFGASDKPVDDRWYTFSRHRAALVALVETLDLANITLVCQDWGGLLGLTLPPQMPQRFAGLLVMNTTLGTGDVALSEGFVQWRAWVATQPDIAVGRLMGRSCPQLTEAERAAYDSPFEDVRAKAGVRRFPQLVPDRPDADGAALSREARAWWRSAWHGATTMVVGAADPVLGLPVMQALRRDLRGCPEPIVLPQAGHFVQEWADAVLHAAAASIDGGAT